MDDRPDTIDFGSPPASPDSGAPSVDARPDTINFGGADLEPSKWTGGAGLPAAPATWSDVGHGFMGGVHDVEATAAGFGASVAGDPTTEARLSAAAQEQQRQAAESREAMTPTVQGGWSHPLVGLAEQAPGAIALAAPAALTGPFAPAVVGGLMGAQTRGDIYNRLKAQGIEPTNDQLNAATALGVAGGLAMDLTGGAAGKLPVSKLVGAVLGVGAEGGVMGATNAATEYTGQADEIAAGKRDNFDSGAILNSTLQGLEAGGIFGVAGLGRHGVGEGNETVTGKTRLPQGGQSAEPTRSQTSYPKPEAQVTAPVDTETPPENKAPPPPPPKVDPAQAVALNPESVTQGVTKPPLPVVQPEGAQPKGATSEDQQGSSPAVQKEIQPLTPQPPPEPQPLPRAAPPVEDAGSITPEPQASLAEQHAQLLDPANDREAMLYPKGEQPLDIPDKKAFGQVKLPDGRIVQFDKSGPSGFTVAKIRQYAKDDRLNEALGLGPVTKTEALQRVQAGEPGTITTERTPDGTEVKGAVGTEATAPVQEASLEASKTPGNTVQTEDVAANHAAQLDKIAQEQVVQPQVVESPAPEITPRVTQTPFGPGKVLEDTTPEGIRARDAAAADDALQAHTVAEQLRAKEVAKQEVAETKRVHTAKADQAKTTADNIAAKRITDKYSAPPKLDNIKRPTEIYDRAKAMVNEAKAAGIKIPDAFPEGHPHNGAMLKLREAADLTKTKTPKWDAYARFLDREGMVDAGKPEDAFEARRNEGAQGLGSPEGAGEGVRVAPKGGAVDEEGRSEEREGVAHEERPEELTGGGEEDREDHEDEAFTPSEANPIAQKMREDWLAKSPEERAEISRQRNISDLKDELRRLELIQRGKYPDNWKTQAKEKATSIKEKLAEKGASKEEIQAIVDKVHKPYISPLRPTTDTGAKVEVRKSRSIKRQMEDEQPGKRMMADEDGNPQEVTVSRTTTAREAIAAHYDASKYARPEQQMNERLIEKVNNLAGDTPVHYIDYKDMQKLGGGYGFYDPHADHIVLATFDGKVPKTDTALHEVFHAATAKALEADPHLRDMMKRLRDDVRANMGSFDLQSHAKLSYALSDPEEFLTGMMTNPDVQRLLKGVKISDELARDLGIPRWRKMTAWEGALNVIRQALGLGPRDVSAIEGAMSLSEQAMWQHPRGTGDLMEAMGRGVRADEGAKPVSLPKLRFQKMTDPEAMHETERELPNRLRDMGGSVGQAALDRMGNLSTAAMKKLPRWANGVQLSRTFGKMFTDKDGNIIEGLLGLNRRKGAELGRRANEDAAIISKAHVLADKFPDHQEAVSKLEHDATKFNVRAEETPTAIKGDPHSKAMDKWGHNAHAPDIHEQFNKLPKELQDFHIEKRQFYADKAKEAADQHIDQVLDNFPLPAGETRASTEKMIKDKDLSDDAKEHYDNLGMLDGLQRDQNMRSGKNVYFNGVRDGDHVVLGKYHMPAGGSAVDYLGGKLPENVREFDTREEAHAFETSTDMHGATKGKYYFEDPNKPGHYVTEMTDPSTGKIVKASSSEYDVRRYQTTLQNEHFETHNSHADAKRGRQAMLDNGLHSVSDVLNKREEGNWGRINSDAGQAMERRIKDRSDLTTDQKRGMIDAARAYNLVSRSGYQSHMMERRNIAGAKYHSADALRTYSNTVNRHIVNKQYAGRMDMLMKRLEDKDDENRYTDQGGMSSAVANEIRERVYRNPDDMAAKNAPWVNRLQSLAYMRWLVGPRHLLMLQTHPYAYSAPQMAGRHGAGIYRALHQSAKEMGGDFSGAKTGVTATFNQARSLFSKDPEKAAQLAATPDVTKDMIGRLKDPEEIAAMNEAQAAGTLHSGFGDEFYGATGYGKVDAMVRQLSSAQDAQNRAIVFHTAFKAERAKGRSFDKSVDYATNIVQDTMGVHSSMDVASAMKNPLARMFMQFKQFPMRQIELMSRNVYNGFKGETPEVKREAWKAFAHQVASGFTMAGVHGLPIGLLKPLGLLGMALGVTPTPSQIDDRFRRAVADAIGPTGANMLMDGALSAVPHAPDVSNMFSYDLDTMFGEPRGADWKSYMADQLLGAAGSTLYDAGSGVNAALHGDVSGALNKLPLPRVIPDFSKAVGLAQNGKTTANGGQITPASYEDAAWRMLGFGTLQQQRIQAGAEAAQADLQEQQQEKKATKGEQLKAKQKNKQTIMGVPVTKQSRALLQERQSVYQ